MPKFVRCFFDTQVWRKNSSFAGRFQYDLLTIRYSGLLLLAPPCVYTYVLSHRVCVRCYRMSLRRSGLTRRFVFGTKLTHCFAERGHRTQGHASLVFVHGLSGSKCNWNSIVDVCGPRPSVVRLPFVMGPPYITPVMDPSWSRCHLSVFPASALKLRRKQRMQETQWAACRRRQYMMCHAFCLSINPLATFNLLISRWAPCMVTCDTATFMSFIITIYVFYNQLGLECFPYHM